jgi:hypothetical protein
LDRETVSRANLLESIAEVSDKFNFSPAVAPAAAANALTFFDTNNVVAMVLSAVAVSCVMVTGRPFNNGEVIVLLVSVSIPAKVAKVPAVGKVTLLAAVVVMVKSPTPLVIILLAIEIVLPLLFTPVPPLTLGTIVPMDNVESATAALPATKA